MYICIETKLGMGIYRNIFSWWFSRKRFGDYGQIHFAKMFPIWMSVGDLSGSVTELWGTSEWLKIGGYSSFTSMNIENTHTLPPAGNDKIEWYRQRTWFFSGDWPAFYWSIYNRINTCMHISGKGAFFCYFNPQ